MIGLDSRSSTGNSVTNAGDVSGDGVDDLLIGAYRRSTNGIQDSGAAYVVFGDTDLGNTGLVELSDLDGSNGFVINGVEFSSNFGASVSGAGDLNGGGYADMVIGAPSAPVH